MSTLRLPAAQAADSGVEFFEKKIRPVFVQSCFTCHCGERKLGGLLLDSRPNLLKGGNSGPAVQPGQPGKSLLLQAIKHEHQRLKMPPSGKLPEAVLADFEKWITMGAPDPRSTASHRPPTSWEVALAERRNWWSLQPVRKPALPSGKPGQWADQAIDRLLFAEMQKPALSPNPPADRTTLIRRAALVLTGLPPQPHEVAAFVNDTSSRAYEQLIDRLLASPQFGERWARHWMDVVRFGETHGFEWNYEVRDAWRYRDYLIRAFNLDVPYDQLVREHLAGDLLSQPRWNRHEQINESRIGTASLRFGEAGHDNFREIGYDQVDNQIDTVSKAFQATTISCARCHDHKLDAVSTRDYYALFGIFLSARQVVHTLDAPDSNAATKQALRSVKAQVQTELATLWQREVAAAAQYLRAAQAARAKSSEATALSQGLDPTRVQKWVAALEVKNTGMEDPASIWNALVGKDAGSEWDRLRAGYEREANERAEFNAKNFTPFGNFKEGELSGWRADGQGLREGVSPSGDFAVACDGEAALVGIYPAGLLTHSLSERLNGSLFSPDVPQGKEYVHVQVVGGKQSYLRMVPDFRHLTDFNREVKLDKPGWMTMGKQKDNYDDRVYFELVTKLDNQRIPERGANKRGATLDDQRSYFGVMRAVVSDQGAPPKEDLSHVLALFVSATTPHSLDEVAERYASQLRKVVSAWAQGRATDEDARWLDWLLRSGLVTNSMKATPRLQELVTRYRDIEKQIEPPRVIAGMGDVAEGMDQRVLQRGDFKNLGDPAPRRYLEVLGGTDRTAARQGSGRSELAEAIVNPQNPLTARVMVNRLWHWMFGSGLVRTVDDFGHMGELPSHPELLDYLAARFVEEGWSIKKLIREIALTRAFQQSARRVLATIRPQGPGDNPPAGSWRQSARRVLATIEDPENRLLSHYHARRLEAESIRDSMLAVSGRLDRQLFGSSIDPYREKPSPERKLYCGPLDGLGRRSLYTKITLMEAPRFLSVLNQPEAKYAQGRRDVTNVPAQALTMLNDPFVVQQAECWAKSLIADGEATPRTRIARMLLAALGRSPSVGESDAFATLVSELTSLHQVAADAVMTSVPLWKDLAHAMFNLKEFVYVP